MIDYLKNTSLTFRIITGLVLGVLTGLFFGEDAAGLNLIADIWIGLMQMTILPYVIVSLIVGLGQLDSTLARQLAVRGGLLMLVFWGIALLVVTVMPMSFPVFENASFYSSQAGETATQFNPVDLYIPKNPFHSMANEGQVCVDRIPEYVSGSAWTGDAICCRDDPDRCICDCCRGGRHDDMG